MGKEWALAPLRALTCPSLAKELGGFCFLGFLFVLFFNISRAVPIYKRK